MSEPNDPRDDTVPAYGEPILLRQAQASLAMQDAALRSFATAAMGAGVIRDDSTPPAKQDAVREWVSHQTSEAKAGR